MFRKKHSFSGRGSSACDFKRLKPHEIRNPKSPGFTLLEVLLALALTAMVLVAVAMAIDIHLRLVDVERTGVVEAQLARALLDRIADDLRSAVHYEPINAEKLVGDLVSQVGAAAGGGVSEEGVAALGGFLEEELGTPGESGTDETGGLAESLGPGSAPGLFGNTYQLQIDTSRLPRADELQGTLSTDDSTIENVLSDVKTVTYYVIADQLGGTGYGSGVSQSGAGLVRLEYNRATMAWAAEQGLLVDMEQDVQPVAPEVAAIEFRYFDGTEWWEEWDSIERGGLPVVVEIAIGIIPARLRNDTEFTSLLTDTQPSLAEMEDLLIYRKLVHLPVARPTTAEDASMISGESTENMWEGFDTGSEASSTGGF